MSNFVKYMGSFTEGEKSSLCFVLNSFVKDEVGEVHKGLLPFLNTEIIVRALNLAIKNQGPAYVRFAKKALAKIPGAWGQKMDSRGNVSFMMKLDPTKVYRNFGANPERGKPLNFLPKVKVTVGKRWSLPKKAWVDDKDVLVSPCVALVRKKPYMWEVTVAVNCRYAVEMWLLEKCT